MKLIKIETNNCMPCKMVGQLLDSTGVEYETKNIATDESVIEKYDIMSVPVVILQDDEGNEVQRVKGFDKEAIEALVDQI